MCPDISPAIGACSSFILSLMSECPVFHITGRPPARSTASASACEDLTSKMIGCPGPGRRVSIEVGRECAADRPRRILGEVPAHDAADVVLAKDRLRDRSPCRHL